MGDQPTSITDMLNRVKGGLGLEQFGIYYGNYRGFVVNNEDPLMQGRVQLRIPQFASDNVIKTWALPKGNSVGNEFGDFFIPPVKSMVWVEFENGDPQFPIYSGGHWGKDDSGGKVPTQAKRQKPSNRIRMSEKCIIEMDDENELIRLSFREGGTSLVLKKSGEIELNGSTIDLNGSSGVNSNTPTTSISGTTQAQGAITAASTVTAAGTVNANGGLSAPAGGNLSGGITIDGKVFLAHTHSGVDAGGDTSGGVV
jgi:uncharacterized protein involved in type VI secretion and phage assembly